MNWNYYAKQYVHMCECRGNRRQRSQPVKSATHEGTSASRKKLSLFQALALPFFHSAPTTESLEQASKS